MGLNNRPGGIAFLVCTERWCLHQLGAELSSRPGVCAAVRCFLGWFQATSLNPVLVARVFASLDAEPPMTPASGSPNLWDTCRLCVGALYDTRGGTQLGEQDQVGDHSMRLYGCAEKLRGMRLLYARALACCSHPTVKLPDTDRTAHKRVRHCLLQSGAMSFSNSVFRVALSRCLAPFHPCVLHPSHSE